MDWASLITWRILTILADRDGSLSEEETLLVDSGVLRLDPYITRLLTRGFIQRDEGRGVYTLTEAGRTEIARLRAAVDSFPE
jgi:DNA-binding PadR family transcriptional regulator